MELHDGPRVSPKPGITWYYYYSITEATLTELFSVWGKTCKNHVFRIVSAGASRVDAPHYVFQIVKSKQVFCGNPDIGTACRADSVVMQCLAKLVIYKPFHVFSFSLSGI